METLLIFRQLTDGELLDVKQKVMGGACIIVLAPGISLNDKSVQIVSLPLDISRKASQHLLDSILALGDKFIGEKTVSEVLNPGNIPLWHYQRFRIYFRLKSLFLIHTTIDEYRHPDSKLSIYCAPILFKYPENENLKFHFATSKLSPSDSKNYRAIFNYSVYFSLRVLISIFSFPNIRKTSHLLVDRSIKQPCRDFNTLSLKHDNYTLSNLLEQSGDDFLIVSEVEQPKLKGSGTFRLSKHLFDTNGRGKRTISGEYLLFRGLLSYRLHREKQRMVDKLQQGIQQVLNAKLSKKEGIIFDEFIKLSKTNNFYIARFLAFNRLFKKFHFVTASAIDENSPATRCILDAVRAEGAKTIGIQHGNIGAAQPAYLYTTTDRQNHIMSDYTLVWGNYWRDFLIEKGNFPPESVLITGQIRTDIIPLLLSIIPRLKEEMQIEKPVALFASQPIPDASLRYRAAFDVFSVFAEQKDCELIVKLHPAEKDAINYYHQIAKEAGCSDFRLLYDVDLYSLLAVSDLVITCYSTVGTEAVYFRKPLIILDHLKEDLLGYKASGVAWQASDADELYTLVNGVCNKDLLPDAEAYQKFVNDYAQRIDGKATARTIEAIRAAKSDVVH